MMLKDPSQSEGINLELSFVELVEKEPSVTLWEVAIWQYSERS